MNKIKRFKKVFFFPLGMYANANILTEKRSYKIARILLDRSAHFIGLLAELPCVARPRNNILK